MVSRHPLCSLNYSICKPAGNCFGWLMYQLERIKQVPGPGPPSVQERLLELMLPHLQLCISVQSCFSCSWIDSSPATTGPLLKPYSAGSHRAGPPFLPSCCSHAGPWAHSWYSQAPKGLGLTSMAPAPQEGSGNPLTDAPTALDSKHATFSMEIF